VIERVRAAADQLFQRTVEWRRELHACPELSFQEHRTAAYLTQLLRGLGMEVRERQAGTGVVGLLSGSGPGPVVALRADMDALPIQETNEVPYRSKNNGVMHACGHDVHMACVLGAAHILHGLRAHWGGTLMLVMQQGEELIPGGASLLLAEGALEKPAPDCIIGQHVTPELEVGKVGFRPGPFMASSDELYVAVVGRGGHAAQPSALLDPIMISAHLLIQLKQEFALLAPEEAKVLAFGRVVADGATNVVPNEVAIAGTLRLFNEALRKDLHEWLPRRAQTICASMGGSCRFEVRRGYPVLVNNADLTARLTAAATEYLGADRVVQMDRRMGSEDFAFYTHALPGCFYRLGTGSAEVGMQRRLHRPDMMIDEEALRVGAGLMAWNALRSLGA
jgi:amidohydrolase